jgi:hypothetical protein
MKDRILKDLKILFIFVLIAIIWNNIYSLIIR